jgi:hypothetical protein
VANDRDSSKQKRARQNRAARSALEARTKAANTPRPSRRAPSSKPSAKAGSAAGTGAARRGLFGGGSKGGGARPGRAPRLGDVPVDVGQLEGGFLKKRMTVPGGLQVLMAFGMTVTLSVIFSLQHFPDPRVTDARAAKAVLQVLHHAAKPPAGLPKASVVAEPNVSLFGLYGGWALLILGLPIVVMGLAVWLTVTPLRRRVWLSCAVAMGAATIGFGFYFNYILAVGFLVYAMIRASRVEGPPPGSRAARAREAAEARRAEQGADEDDDEGDEELDEVVETTGTES